MKTALKFLSVLVIGVIAYYYIQSEIYKSEMRENSLRIQNEIDRQNRIVSLDSAANERRKREHMAELRLAILKKK